MNFGEDEDTFKMLLRRVFVSSEAGDTVSVTSIIEACAQLDRVVAFL
jgi:hypothetical protein